MRFRSISIGLAFLVSGTVTARVANAQDAPRNLPAGGRSVLMGNTGVALGRDGSAPFLNPATIVEIDDTRIAFSVNLYRLSFMGVSGFYQPRDTPPSPFTGLSLNKSNYLDTQFEALPSTLCLFFTIGKGLEVDDTHPKRARQKLGLCFGQTSVDDFVVTASSIAGHSPTLNSSVSLSATERLRVASIGPTYSLRVTDHFDVGLSLHGTLTSRRVQWRASSLSLDASSKAITTTLLDDATGTSFAFTGLAGATYRARPVTLGLAVSLPSVHLYGSSRLATETQVVGTSADGTTVTNASGTFTATPPVRIDVGAGFDLGKNLLEFDFGISLPHKASYDASLSGSQTVVSGGVASVQPFNKDFLTPARLTLGLAGGFEHHFNPAFSLLGGASIDIGFARTSAPADTAFHDYPASQNHVTGSFGFGSHRSGGELLIGTQLAYGFGERYVPDIFSLTPGFATVNSQTLSVLFVIAGTANFQSIKRAIEDVESVVNGAPTKK